MKKLMLGAASIALLAACSPSATDEPGAPAETAEATSASATTPNEDGKYVTSEGLELSAADYWGDWGIDLTLRDETIDPGNNFYAYANGVMEPWDGPAAICAHGGRWVLAGPLRLPVPNGA